MLQPFIRLILAAVLLFGQAAAVHAQPAGGLPAPATDVEYIAKNRDTMIGIARRYLVDGERFEVQRALWEYNKLKDKDRINPGQVIRIPENWLKEDANAIQLAHVEGEVTSKGQPLQAGAKLAPGDDFKTGKNGYVKIKLADGSTLDLKPGSDLSIEGVRKSPLAPAADAQFLLKTGRVEASVAKRNPGGARFEVRTPIAVAAVRGTQFRVTADEANRSANSEVIEGEVQVNDTGNLGNVSVREGFGTRVNEGQAPLPPRALLPAPRLWTGIRLWVRRPIRLNFTRLPGAVRYRVLVARKPDFAEVISEELLATNVITLPELANGPYYLKVRGIDDIGLEGKETPAELVLTLDPLPQAPATPAAAPAAVPTPDPAAAPGAPATPPAAVPGEPTTPPARQP